MEVFGLIIPLIVIGLLLLVVIGSRIKEYKKHRKANLIYALVAALCFFIIGSTGFIGLVAEPFYYFIVIQALVLIVGSLNAYLLFRLLPWASTGKFIGPFLYSLAIAFLGGAFLLLAFILAKLHDHRIVFLSSLVWFMVPFFFLMALQKLYAIPPKIFKNWFYPLNKTIDDPSDSEFASPVVISFVFLKNREDQEVTIFRAKAPKLMQFGKLFYYFINDYNDRNQAESIEIIDKNNSPFAWLFYYKLKFPWIRKYIDPDESVNVNGIKENSVIVCRRIEDI